MVLSTEDGNVAVWRDFGAPGAEGGADAVTERVPGEVTALAAAPAPGGGFVAAVATAEHGVRLLRGTVGAGGALSVAASELGAAAGPTSPAQARPRLRSRRQAACEPTQRCFWS